MALSAEQLKQIESLKKILQDDAKSDEEVKPPALNAEQQKQVDALIKMFADENAKSAKKAKKPATEDSDTESVEVIEPKMMPYKKVPGSNPAGASNKFISVEAFTPGAQNVVLNGPWVTFWCSDCGRKLASRSIHEHWAKSHGSKNNNVGLRNMVAYASNELVKIEGAQTAKRAGASTAAGSDKKVKPAKASTKTKVKVAKAPKKPKGPTLFGVRTSTTRDNPFFAYVDNTPEPVYRNFTKDQWTDIFMMFYASMSFSQRKLARDAIDNHFGDN